jgi:hypothetical protein
LRLLAELAFDAFLDAEKGGARLVVRQVNAIILRIWAEMAEMNGGTCSAFHQHDSGPHLGCSQHLRQIGEDRSLSWLSDLKHWHCVAAGARKPG